MSNTAQQFMDTPEDCQWLQETHLRYYNDIVPEFKSFILIGNEDYPDGIALYESRSPLVDDKPLLRLWEAEEKGYRELDDDEAFE